MHCPYCHTNVLLSGQSRASNEKKTQAFSKAKVGFRLTVLIVLLAGALIAVIFGIVATHGQPTEILSSSRSDTPPFANMTMEFGSKGITPGHFEGASCIALDHQRRIYVGEGKQGRVQVFDTTGKYLSEFSVGGFDDLVVDRDGTLYAASGGKICRFNGATGARLPDMERRTEEQFGKESPVYYRCVSVTPGVIYAVTGYGADKPGLVKLSTLTGRVESVVQATSPANEMLNLHGILALTTGEIYGLDTQIEAVFKFSPDGAYINKFGGASDDAQSDDPPPSNLQSPSCMASDSQGRIYIGNSSGIKVYDKNGNYINGFGGDNLPNGIAIDDQDNIYACFNNCVREYVLQKR